MKDADGYFMAATIWIYPRARADALPTLPVTTGRSAINACPIDAQTDVVIPIAVELKNTTQGFSARLQVRLGLSEPGRYVFGDVQYSRGLPNIAIPSKVSPTTLGGAYFVNWDEVARE